MGIVTPSHPPRGVFRKTSRRWGGRRRPRAGLVTPRSGGPGSRLGALRPPAGSLLTDRRFSMAGRASACDEAMCRTDTGVQEGRRGRRTKSAAREAEKSPQRSAGRRAFAKHAKAGRLARCLGRPHRPPRKGAQPSRVSRCSAPLTLLGRNATAHPGPVKNRGDGAC